VFVYILTYMYVCVYIYTYKHMHTLHTYTHTPHTHIRTQRSTYIRTHLCTYMNTRAHLFTFVCVCVYVYVYSSKANWPVDDVKNDEHYREGFDQSSIDVSQLVAVPVLLQSVLGNFFQRQ
jgi:hypothetical protein